MEEEVFELIGHDLAALFFDTFGGCLIYFPCHLDIKNNIVLCIGVDAAKKLSRYFSKQAVPIPTCHKTRLNARNQSIKRDRESGHTMNDLAIKYQLTTRQLYTICKPLNQTGKTQ